MTQPSKAQQGGLAGVAGIGGAIIGIVAGRYLGIYLLIPGGVAVLAGWILAKILPPRVKPMVAAVAILIGHAAWMAFGVVFADGDRMLMVVSGVEIALLLGAAAWLALRPNLAAVIVAGAYQLLSLAVNTYHFTGQTFGTGTHRALLAHMLLRIAGLIAMVVGLVVMRRHALAERPAFPVMQEPAA